MSNKYPRTFHLPWSPGGTSDDKRLVSAEHFVGQEVVITEKLDGGNLCFTQDAVYARSHSSSVSGPMYARAKALHAQVASRIPAGLSVFMEHTEWVHSIEYEHLDSYFHIIGVRDDGNGYWFPWLEATSISVMDVAKELGLPTVPVMYWGNTLRTEDEFRRMVESICQGPSVYGGPREGIVIRFAQGFRNFENAVAKWVRKGHVVSEEHWMKGPLQQQKLEKEA